MSYTLGGKLLSLGCDQLAAKSANTEVNWE